MTENSTPYGRVIVGTQEELYRRAAGLVMAARPIRGATAPLIALSGGSTPQDWFRWCVKNRALPEAQIAEAHFTVSDERCVPLTDPQSNFGHADQLLLEPLHVPAAHRHAWAVGSTPAAAAIDHAATVRAIASPSRTYDVCFLGLGEDSHTASLFPGSALLRDEQNAPFAAIETPGKGWRLTITPTGLRACQLVVVLAMGTEKAAPFRRVMQSPYDPVSIPAQILKTCAEKVVWLVDPVVALRG